MISLEEEISFLNEEMKNIHPLEKEEPVSWIKETMLLLRNIIEAHDKDKYKYNIFMFSVIRDAMLYTKQENFPENWPAVIMKGFQFIHHANNPTKQDVAELSKIFRDSGFNTFPTLEK